MANANLLLILMSFWVSLWSLSETGAWASVAPHSLTSQAVSSPAATIAITPNKVHATQNQTLTFKAAGGKPPYLFDLARGEGSLDPKTGTYKTGSPGYSVIRVTDSAGSTAEAITIIYQPVKMVPPPFTQYSPGTTARFSAMDGHEPYTFALKSGDGAIDPETGVYTSPKKATEATVQVTDSLGQSDTFTIQVAPPLKLSQKYEKVLVGSVVNLQIQGGVPPFHYSKISGPGSIDPATGIFTASSHPAIATVRVTDARGIFQDAVIETRGLLDIYPLSKKVIAGEKIKFEAIAGSPPFKFFVVEGDGTVDPKTGAFVSGKKEGRSVIKVVDSLGTFAQAEVIVTGNLLSSAKDKLIVAGYSHTCAIVDGKVRCWGDNRKAQLGNKDREKSSLPMDVIGLPARALALAAGTNHTCALLEGGNVWCWGDNSTGQLGVNSPAQSITPIRISGFPGPVSDIAAGDGHNCAVSLGAAFCWGDNHFGQLGINSTVSSRRPIIPRWLVQGVQSITAGAKHSCAVVKSKVLCWGENSAGQLGTGRYARSLIPVEILGDRTFETVEAGANHTCGISAGSIYCWGSNGMKQAANTLERYVLEPTRVEGLPSSAHTLSLGNFHSCALYQDAGQVRCWGLNLHGQLGDGTSEIRSRPTAPLGLPHRVSGLAAGNDHSCALLNAKTFCWGSNLYGQAGNEAFGDIKTPEPVKKLF